MVDLTTSDEETTRAHQKNDGGAVWLDSAAELDRVWLEVSARDAAAGLASTVAGGSSNSATALFGGTVVGGQFNTAGGDYSFAAGQSARVRDRTESGDITGDEGTFIWSDATATPLAPFTSDGPNQCARNITVVDRSSRTVVFTIHTGQIQLR